MKSIFSEAETMNEVIAQQIDVLGSQDFPARWREQWEGTDGTATDADEVTPRRPTGDREEWPPLREAFEEFVQKYRIKRVVAGAFSEEEANAIIDLMQGMLKFRPEERLTIGEVLQSD